MCKIQGKSVKFQNRRDEALLRYGTRCQNVASRLSQATIQKWQWPDLLYSELWSLYFSVDKTLPFVNRRMIIRISGSYCYYEHLMFNKTACTYCINYIMDFAWCAEQDLDTQSSGWWRWATSSLTVAKVD